MKKTLFLALMLMIAATSFAQQQIATLNHNDSISVFYGTYAFRDAHNIAVNGDIITLSSGSFAACNITKAITLRGAGAHIDTIAGTYPTIITGEFIINIPKEAEHYLTMEGIFLNERVRLSQSYNAKFTRCNMLELQTYPFNSQHSVTENIEITNCCVQDFSDSNNFASTSSFNFVNSVVCFRHSYRLPVQFINSLVIMCNSIQRASAYNCIITRSGNNDFSMNSSAYNCIFIENGYSSSILQNQTNNTNVTYNKLNEVFETWHSFTSVNFSFDERYILKEEIATSFLGSDGTEVGIHGGIFPFDTRPSYMVVKKCNVANKSTIDGKLSVDIEVMVEE